MSLLKFSNNASTTLASPITIAATSVTVAAGQGVLFPALAGAQYFNATFVKNGNPAVFEILKVTAHSTDTFTITRAQEGSTAAAWATGDFFNLFLTAAGLAVLSQVDDLQAQAGNYSADSGSAANIYVVSLTPAIAAHIVGAPIRFVAAHACTGASTFNDGAGAAPLVTADGSALQTGDILAGGIYEAIWTGTNFLLVSVHHQAFSQILGSIGSGQVPLAAVQQYQGSLAIAFSQLTGSIANGQVPSSAVTQYQSSLSIAWSQLTGTKNADQLQGATAATTAAASSIAERDSSGNLTSNDFIETAAPTNPTVRNIWVDAGDGVAQRIALANFMPAIGFGASISTNGYQKFSSGLILQWGFANPAGNNAGITVNFPIPFPTGCLSVSAISVAGGPVQTWLTALPGTSSFQLANSGGTSFWIAVGN